jgi:hypothetical protein
MKMLNPTFFGIFGLALSVSWVSTNALLARSIIKHVRFQYQQHFYDDGSALFMTSKTAEMCVDELLDQVTTKKPDREVVQELLLSLSTDATVDNSKDATTKSLHVTNSTTVDPTLFEPLLGYYNVSYTLTTHPKDNPVGGKWTRLWKVQRMLQHVLPKEPTDSSDTAVVAQVVNAIRLELFFGLIGIWVVLRGDAVPLRRDLADKAKAEKGNVQTANRDPPLLPNLSDRTVRVYFDKPRIGVSLYGPRNASRNKALLGQRVLTLGPTSSVVLDTPYVDDRIRLGKGGTSGSQFVFARVSKSDKEATDGWRWVAETSIAALNKTGIMIRIGLCEMASILAYTLVRNTVVKRIAGVYSIAAALVLGWLALSTGGIETRGDTYTKGDDLEAGNFRVGCTWHWKES